MKHPYSKLLAALAAVLYLAGPVLAQAPNHSPARHYPLAQNDLTTTGGQLGFAAQGQGRVRVDVPPDRGAAGPYRATGERPRRASASPRPKNAWPSCGR